MSFYNRLLHQFKSIPIKYTYQPNHQQYKHSIAINTYQFTQTHTYYQFTSTHTYILIHLLNNFQLLFIINHKKVYNHPPQQIVYNIPTNIYSNQPNHQSIPYLIYKNASFIYLIILSPHLFTTPHRPHLNHPTLNIPYHHIQPQSTHSTSMPERAKPHKPTKTVFTIVTDRLREDSSQELYSQPFLPQNDLNLLGFQFPLDYELQEIHQSPQAQELSAYIMHLQSQVKSITNKIQYEYHQARETVLFLGQSTSMSKHVTRKKVDQEFAKMGILRKYQPNLKQLATNDIDQDTLAKQPGDLAIDQVKRKIQIEWQSQISDQMEKQRRRMRQAEKKRQKQLQQIDKDFQKLMKKRKTQKQLQAQLKSQESLKSLAQNGEDSSNRTPKKIQKRQKALIKSQKSVNNNKRSSKGSVERNSVRESEIQSCSVMDNNRQNLDEGNSDEQVHNGDGQ